MESKEESGWRTSSAKPAQVAGFLLPNYKFLGDNAYLLSQGSGFSFLPARQILCLFNERQVPQWVIP